MYYEEERKQKIYEYVQKNSRASVQKLSKIFDVSDSTIRRDLTELEEANLLKRTHGGAVFLEAVSFEPDYEEKEDKLRQEKNNIAKKAVEFIEEGDTIIIDAGTTTLRLASELNKFSKLTVITNSFLIANEIRGSSGIEIIITGGQLRGKTKALVGPIAEQCLNMFHVDKVFIGANGLTINEGITTPNVLEASTKRKMIEVADKAILLVDNTKIGRVSFSKISELSRVEKIITDSGTADDTVKEIEKLDVRVYIAK